MRIACALVLLCFGACDSGDCQNQPPTLDWRLSTPAGFEYPGDRSSGVDLYFSVEDAVRDSNGDQLYFLWYTEVPGSGKGPVPVVGDLAMELFLCGSFSLATAERVHVTVAVSDSPISFDDEAEPFPIDSNGAPYTMRAWTVRLMGDCTEPR